MAMTLLVLLLIAAAAMWPTVKPQPVRARRDLLQEELFAAYLNQREAPRS
jgi:hypothetical protein